MSVLSGVTLEIGLPISASDYMTKSLGAYNSLYLMLEGVFVMHNSGNSHLSVSLSK